MCIIVNFTLFSVSISEAPDRTSPRVVVGFGRTGRSDRPPQMSSNVQQFLTDVEQSTSLFLALHHLPERVNESTCEEEALH